MTQILDVLPAQHSTCQPNTQTESCAAITTRHLIYKLLGFPTFPLGLSVSQTFYRS